MKPFNFDLVTSEPRYIFIYLPHNVAVKLFRSLDDRAYRVKVNQT